jgi:type 1 glutamine amidotransferase
MASRSALVVSGGWDGHAPVAATEMFIPSLVAHGFDVTVSTDLDVYADGDTLLRHDLIIQCWSMGRLTEAQSAGLRFAVQAGVGFAGWHGGVVATFTGDRDYLRMVGGQFLFHHPSFIDYRVTVVPSRAEHPVVAGVEPFDVHTEQYWVITDAHNDVLATTPYEPYEGGGFDEPVTMPVVWTRRWGAGRVFVSTIGHRVSDLEVPAVRTITERGLIWASR